MHSTTFQHRNVTDTLIYIHSSNYISEERRRHVPSVYMLPWEPSGYLSLSLRHRPQSSTACRGDSRTALLLQLTSSLEAFQSRPHRIYTEVASQQLKSQVKTFEVSK